MTNNIVKRSVGQAPVIAGVFDNVFRSRISRFLDDDFWGFQGVQGMAKIPVNLHDTGKTFEMEVIAPGLKKEDFNINLNKDLLTISYEHKEEATEGGKEDGKEKDWLRKEYRHQSFSRSFSLDEIVDAEKIEARYNDGVLYVSLPKKEAAQIVSKNIQIK